MSAFRSIMLLTGDMEESRVPLRSFEEEEDEVVGAPRLVLDPLADDGVFLAETVFFVFLLMGVASTSEPELMGDVESDRKIVEPSCS